MQEIAERAYFFVCLALGRLLRSSRYSKVRIIHQDDQDEVRKQRLFYAPLLVWLAGPLVRVLDTGVTVLSQHDWQERERLIYRSLHEASIGNDADGTLVLPHLRGETLATLLDSPRLDEATRKQAIELATSALSEFHRLGFTHGDAMAENVMVDLEAGIAHWFDFETVHDSNRSLAWRRADDVRALIATCLLRTAPARFRDNLCLILDVYGDEDVTRVLASSFTTVQRPLPFHLGQAALSFQHYREIDRLLKDDLGQ
jgi:hypothetical protein